jgi:hypothetical protein
MSAWQSIETAPKDGTRVLLHHPHAEDETVVAGFWGEWGGAGPCWITDHAEGWLNPTHWMPLPAPPSSTVKGRE